MIYQLTVNRTAVLFFLLLSSPFAGILRADQSHPFGNYTSADEYIRTSEALDLEEQKNLRSSWASAGRTALSG